MCHSCGWCAACRLWSLHCTAPVHKLRRLFSSCCNNMLMRCLLGRRYWAKSGVSDKVDGRLGPALEGLQQLLQQEGPGSFDFAFIDADKRGYQAYFELCLQLVKPGGCIAVDNVLFYGKVADAAVNDKATLALRQFNKDLMADERVSFSIVPIGDGMALCRKQ